MNPHEYQRAKELFLSALELEPKDRPRFLAAACAAADDLRERVAGMLAEHEREEYELQAIVDGGTQAPADRMPDRIGRYKITSMLGEGGMGVVYRAEQTEPVRREVALKLIKLGMDTKEVLARFETERQALALMNHPHVARVFDGGMTAQGRPYFVMEFVPGVPITEFCDAQRLSANQRLRLFQDVCHAVQHAHQKGIIHRDLKPSNVLVAMEDGQPVVKVIDFGVAKATQQRLTEHTLFTQQGQMIGTPRYMSPEQAGSDQKDIDTRTDVYSLGVLLYELLVGAGPFEDRELRAAGLAEMQRFIREVDPPKPSTRLSSLGEGSHAIARDRATEPQALMRMLRGDLDWVVMRCLEKERSRRYGSAAELADDLSRYLDSRPVRARPPSRTYQFKKLVVRHRLAVAGASLLLLGSVSTSIVVSTLWLRSESFRRQADDHWRSLLAQQEKRAAAEMLAAQAKAEADQSAKITDERVRFARGMHNFFLGVLHAASPARGGRTDVTLREALTKGMEAPNLYFSDIPEVEVRVRTFIGYTLCEWGEFDAAETHLLRAREIQSGLSNVRPIDQAEVANILAGIYYDRGDYEKAEPLYREVLDLSLQHAGPKAGDQQVLAVSYNDVGATLRKMGRTEEAVEYFEHAAQLFRKSLGPVHWQTLQATYNLACCLEELGEPEEALKWQEEILALRRRHLGDHVQVARSLERIGEIHLKQGRGQQAEPFLREAVAIDRRLLGADHAHYGRTLTRLARALMALEQLVEAETLLREAHSICRAKLAPEAPEYRETVAAMCLVLERQGRLEEARPMCAEAELAD